MMKYVIGGMKYSLAKTRTSVNFAIYLSKVKNRNVLLIDADPSECASAFMAWKQKNNPINNLKFMKLTTSSIADEILKVEGEFDDIVIESGVGQSLEYSLRACDRLIVPFREEDQGLWTMWTLANIESMIYRALDENPDLKAFSILVKSSKKNLNADEILKALENSQHIQYLNSTVFSNKIFGGADSALNGLKDFKQIKVSLDEKIINLFEGLSS